MKKTMKILDLNQESVRNLTQSGTSQGDDFMGTYAPPYCLTCSAPPPQGDQH